MKNIALSAALLAFISSPSQAQPLDSMQKANNLGSVLAAEDFCGFRYDQDAISAWVDNNIEPSDLGFASTLQTMTEGAKFQLQGMSGSQKTAHCRSVERAAKHYKFIAE